MDLVDIIDEEERGKNDMVSKGIRFWEFKSEIFLRIMSWIWLYKYVFELEGKENLLMFKVKITIGF